jgi:Zn-dependent peptidase ImmA (M78 family)/transcriptional regulator with XRE-family HTH domain
MPLAAVLKHVRTNRHFELVDVSRSTGISPTRLKEFEAGTREPSFRQFEALAEAYGVPSYLLGAEALPNLPQSPIDFRKASPRPAHLSPEGMQKIWDGEQVAQAAKQLLDATKAPLAAWAHKVPTGGPSAATGAKLRVYFDKWRAERQQKFGFSGRPEQIFLGSFRLFLEAQGIIVRINQAPPEDFFGFYLDVEAGLPVTFVNRKIFAPKAQLFTALHEYGHSMLNASGVSDPFAIKNQVERSCNRFAAEFLAPQPEFSAAVEATPRAIRADVFRLVDFVSQRSMLSKHATAIRLKEMEYIDQRELNGWLTARAKLSIKELKGEDEEEIESGFGQVHAKLVGEIGYLPTYLSGIALKEKIISSVDIVNSISLSQSVQEKAIALATRRMEVAVS